MSTPPPPRSHPGSSPELCTKCPARPPLVRDAPPRSARGGFNCGRFSALLGVRPPSWRRRRLPVPFSGARDRPPSFHRRRLRRPHAKSRLGCRHVGPNLNACGGLHLVRGAAGARAGAVRCPHPLPRTRPGLRFGVGTRSGATITQAIATTPTLKVWNPLRRPLPSKPSSSQVAAVAPCLVQIRALTSHPNRCPSLVGVNAHAAPPSKPKSVSRKAWGGRVFRRRSPAPARSEGGRQSKCPLELREAVG